MRVLFIHTYYYPENMGGAEISVQKLAEALVKHGVEVYVLCTSDNNRREIINGVNIWRIKPYVSMRYINYNKRSIGRKIITRWQVYVERFLDLYNPENYRMLKSYIKEIAPDVVHTNCLYHFGIASWQAARDCNIPVINTLRDFYFLCQNVNLRHSFSGKYCDNPNILCRIRKKVIRDNICQNVTCLTTPSKTMADMFYRNMSLPKDSIKIVYNAIDFDEKKVSETIYERLNKSAITVHFVYLGTLGEYKGVKWMIDCFEEAAINDAYLHIAGKGKLLEYVMRKCKENPKIIYEGFLHEDEIRKLLFRCDVLLCPSLWAEPFGRVVLDAYKHGLPVIASDQGALPEIVKDQKTGIIVTAENKYELINAFKRATDKSFINNTILNIPKQLEKFSINSQVIKFMEIYSDLKK